MYYYINSAFSATTYAGSYTGNGEQTRTINVYNGKYLILNSMRPQNSNFGIGTLIFVLYGIKTSVYNPDRSRLYYSITFENNTILIENAEDFTYMNNLNASFQWAIFA